MRHRRLCICFVLTVLACSCSPPQKVETAGEEKVLVTVNGTPVTARDVERRVRSLHGDLDLDTLSPDLRRRIAEEAVEAEIVDRLLLEAAREEGIVVEEKEVDRELRRVREVMEKGDYGEMLEARNAEEEDFRRFVHDQILIRAFQDKLFAEIEVEEGVLEEYFEGHPEKFTEPPQVRLHVMILQNQERLASVMKSLEGGRTFEDLADDMAKEGARVSRTRLMPVEAVPKGLREKVLSAAPGEVVINESASGEVSIAKVLERKEARQMDFEEAGDLVRATIQQVRRQKILDDWYESRLKTENIEYHRPQKVAPDKAK